MYGLSAADMKKAGETPWGKVVEREREWWEIGHHVKSFVWDGFVVDGVWEALKGLGTPVNPWGDGFTDAWSGLFGVVGCVGLYTAAPFDWALDKTLGPDEEAADEKRMKQATRDFGKAMVAWDQWGENPTRAAGLVTFNVLTPGIGATKAGNAGKLSKTVNTAGRLADPMTYIGKGVGATVGKLPRTSEVATNLNRVTTGLVTKLPDGRLVPPPGSGAFPEGPSTPTRPDHPPSHLPTDTVRLPDGKLLTPSGRLLDADGHPIHVSRHDETVAASSAAGLEESATPAARLADNSSAASAVNAADDAGTQTTATATDGSGADLTGSHGANAPREVDGPQGEPSTSAETLAILEELLPTGVPTSPYSVKRR
ncbi:hypothetical protein [Streptomyces sparsus]